MKIKNRTANLLYLAVLWCVAYVFIVWKYVNFHWLRPRDLPESVFASYCMWIISILLVVEFSLNFPAKHWTGRLLAGILAYILLVMFLPTL